jgi:copper transport protein
MRRHSPTAFWPKASLPGLIALALVVLLFGRAQAHAALLRSDPADNSVLDQPPQEIKLWFSEALIPEFSSVQLLAANGQPIEPISTRQDLIDPTLLIVTPPGVDSGIYTLQWRVNSAVDGHANSGYIAFRVGSAGTTASPQTNPTPAAAARDASEIFLRGINYLGLTVLIGIVGVLSFVLGRYPGRKQDQADSEIDPQINQAKNRLLKILLLTALALLAVGLAQAAWQIGKSGQIGAANTGRLSGEAYLAASKVLLRTSWGAAWSVHALLLVLLIGLAGIVVLGKSNPTINDRRRNFLIAFAALVAGLAITQSMVSHAAAMTNPLVPILVNTLHVIFVGLWIGGLIALAAGLLPGLLKNKNRAREITRAAWGPYSRVAALSVGMVFATGLYSTGREAVSPDALLLNPYGQVLLLKIGLVFLVGLIGLVNSILLHPGLAAPLVRRLHKPAGWTPISIKRFPTFVAAEIGFGIVVLLIVGILTTLPPARGSQFLLPAHNQLDPLIEPANDLWIKLSIKPNQPGANLFNVSVLNSRRPAPAGTLRVIVRSIYLDQDFGVATQDAVYTGQDKFEDLYRLTGNQLSQPGHWKIEVIVRRKGLPDSRAEFSWRVFPPGGYSSPVVSRFGWGSVLAISAILIATATVGLLYRYRARLN